MQLIEEAQFPKRGREKPLISFDCTGQFLNRPSYEAAPAPPTQGVPSPKNFLGGESPA